MEKQRYFITVARIVDKDGTPQMEKGTFEFADFMEAVLKYNELCELGGSIILVDTETNQIVKQCMHYIKYSSTAEQHSVSIS